MDPNRAWPWAVPCKALEFMGCIPLKIWTMHTSMHENTGEPCEKTGLAVPENKVGGKLTVLLPAQERTNKAYRHGDTPEIFSCMDAILWQTLEMWRLPG